MWIFMMYMTATSGVTQQPISAATVAATAALIACDDVSVYNVYTYKTLCCNCCYSMHRFTEQYNKLIMIFRPVVLYRVTPITIAIRLRYACDTTIPRRIRLRRKWSKLWFAFNWTAIRLRHDSTKSWHVNFLLASNPDEWKQAHNAS